MVALLRGGLRPLTLFVLSHEFIALLKTIAWQLLVNEAINVESCTVCCRLNFVPPSTVCTRGSYYDYILGCVFQIVPKSSSHILHKHFLFPLNFVLVPSFCLYNSTVYAQSQPQKWKKIAFS